MVDDEEQIRRALRSILRTRNYAVNLAETGHEALVKAIDEPPDLIILDLALPDMSGIEVCRELRSWTSVPILVLSVARPTPTRSPPSTRGPMTTSPSRSRPASCSPACGRFCGGRRRWSRRRPPPVGELTVDIARRLVTVRGEQVSLTPTEFDILALLAQNAGTVVTQKMVLERSGGRRSSTRRRACASTSATCARRSASSPADRGTSSPSPASAFGSAAPAAKVARGRSSARRHSTGPRRRAADGTPAHGPAQPSTTEHVVPAEPWTGQHIYARGTTAYHIFLRFPEPVRLRRGPREFVNSLRPREIAEF